MSFRLLWQFDEAPRLPADSSTARFHQERYRPKTALSTQRELIVACVPMRSNGPLARPQILGDWRLRPQCHPVEFSHREKNRTFKEHRDVIEGVTFAPDGKIITVCSSGVICLWDPDSDRLLWRTQKRVGALLSVTFTPDGKHFVTTGKDGAILLWRYGIVKSCGKERAWFSAIQNQPRGRLPLPRLVYTYSGFYCLFLRICCRRWILR